MTPKELAALHARVFTVPRAFLADEFAALLALPSVFLCTAENGFLLGRVIADEAELLTLAVDPDARGQGTGTRLVQDFHAKAIARGAINAFLEVDERNAPACALYARSGYAQTGERAGYYRHLDGTRSAALILRRALTDDDRLQVEDRE